MPKLADYKLDWYNWRGTWEIHNPHKPSVAIEPDSKDWFEWLYSIPVSFHFKGKSGHFTARKEQRRDETYWYAYLKAGSLHKAYLGKTEELTQTRLEEVAARLSNKSFG